MLLPSILYFDTKNALLGGSPPEADKNKIYTNFMYDEDNDGVGSDDLDEEMTDMEGMDFGPISSEDDDDTDRREFR